MAKVKEGASSDLSGKADGRVYVQFKGGVYTRRLPKWNKDSWTPGMLQNLERFKSINAFCALFKDSLIPQIWNGLDPRMSGYALFLKTNKEAFGPDGSLLNAKKIRLSIGNLSFPEGFEARRSDMDENRIEVKWPKQMHVGGIHLFDELMVISCVDGQYSEITPTGIVRNDLGGTFSLSSSPMPPAQGPVHLYLFFASPNHRDYSESECFEV
ncbi:MAG TPA: hypothetical protein VK205_17105 [Prolixibacteraceae bacterium]|nr:hypothetical protein [Prolixibacteraceae bacterium]